jgi:hypothetical protein
LRRAAVLSSGVPQVAPARIYRLRSHPALFSDRAAFSCFPAETLTDR